MIHCDWYPYEPSAKNPLLHEAIYLFKSLYGVFSIYSHNHIILYKFFISVNCRCNIFQPKSLTSSRCWWISIACRLYCHRHPRGSLHTRRLGGEWVSEISFGSNIKQPCLSSLVTKETWNHHIMFQGKGKPVWCPIFFEYFWQDNVAEATNQSCQLFQGFVSLRWIGATLVIVAGGRWCFVLVLALSVAVK